MSALPTKEQSLPLDTGRLRWRFGNVELDETSLTLVVAGEAVVLEPKPLELLMFLLRRVGEVVTREEILDALWQGRVVTDGVISNCVAKLRAAIRDQDQSTLRTVPRYGYRLDAKVERLLPVESQSAPSNSLQLQPGAALPLRANWVLLRQLSSGAHGELWLAQHEKLKEQRVIKFARSVAGLSALKREITLYRVLSETLGESEQFVRLLDWNVQEPPFFIETEYCELGNLADWCAIQGGVKAIPLALRLNLAAQAAAAAAAAHSAGVLHKDLKPSNILVALDAQGYPRLRLCDFAAGGVLDPERINAMGITRLGFTLSQSDSGAAGTLLYMAPEVLSGHPPTVLADVYSLGVLLFQLLVGDFKRAPSPGWEVEIDDPLLREDISFAAAGDPARRLSDAGQLALRLRSLPARRAELEARHTVAAQAELMREALKRTQARRGLLIALACTLAFGALLASWLYIDARKARDEARSQARASEAIQAFLTNDLLAAANPFSADGSNLRVRDLLDASVKALDERFPQNTVTKAKLQKVIGGAFGALGDVSTAEPLLLAAEETLNANLGAAHPDTQAARLALRDSYRISVKLAKLAAVLRRIKAAEDGAGRPNLDIWYDASGGLLFTDCVTEAGGFWLADCSAPVLQLAEKARVELGNDHVITGRLLWISGVTMVLSLHPAQSEPVMREAVANFSKHYPVGNALLAEANLYWAAGLMAVGKPAEARVLLEKVMERLKGSTGPGQSFALTAQAFLGRSMVALGEVDRGIEQMLLSLEGRSKSYGMNNPGTIMGLQPLVEILIQHGRAEQAVALLQGLDSQIKASNSGATAETLWLQSLLVDALDSAGRSASSQAMLDKNLLEARSRFVRGQWLLGYVIWQKAHWLLERGERDASLPLLEEALRILEASAGKDDPRTQRARADLVRVKAPALPARS